MKLLSSFQLATPASIATVQACIFCICYARTWIRPMVKSRSSMKKTVITMRCLIELVYCLLST